MFSPRVGSAGDGAASLDAHMSTLQALLAEAGQHADSGVFPADGLSPVRLASPAAASDAHGGGAAARPRVAATAGRGARASTRGPKQPKRAGDSPVRRGAKPKLTSQARRASEAAAAAQDDNAALRAELADLYRQQEHTDAVAEQLAQAVAAVDAVLSGKALGSRALALQQSPAEARAAPTGGSGGRPGRGPQRCHPAVSAGALVARLHRLFDADGDQLLCPAELQAMVECLGGGEAGDGAALMARCAEL